MNYFQTLTYYVLFVNVKSLQFFPGCKRDALNRCEDPWYKKHKGKQREEERERRQTKEQLLHTHRCYMCFTTAAWTPSSALLKWSHHRVPPSPTAATKPSRGLSCFNTNNFWNPIYSSWLHFFSQSHHYTLHRCVQHFDFCCYIRAMHACVWECVCVREFLA